MTIATWILAIATLALAIEGGAAFQGWLAHLQVGRRKRELAEIRPEITLLQHVVWMDVATAGQGTRSEVDEKVRRMLQLDGGLLMSRLRSKRDTSTCGDYIAMFQAQLIADRGDRAVRLHAQRGPFAG